jgi:serine/threonine protein kinase
MTPELTTAIIPGEPCLTEEEVLAFAGGQLPLEQRERAHRHLDTCEECQQLLSEAAHALATERSAGLNAAEQVAWSTTFRPGVVVGGRYVIRGFIARGGMGEVYEAFDRELQQRVALKTVTSTAGDNPNAVRRLKAEVQLARRVSHPNVCRIYDFGTHQLTNAAPISFLTMEFVDGETLGTRIRQRGALQPTEALALGRKLLRGLAAAHDAGVLHRDFKSDNVILRCEGERLEPLILDFGLARALDESGEHSSMSGRGLVGTLAYLAPEQLEGKPYTTASDVYSFGLVWYEMLTGELPFKARSSPAVTTLDRLTKVVPPPSTKNALVSRELDRVVLACLRRAPTDRLQTAGDVLARLDELERVATTPKTRPRQLLLLGLTGIALASVYVALVRSATRAAVVPPSAPSAALVVAPPAVLTIPRPSPPVEAAAIAKGAVTSPPHLTLGPLSNKPKPPSSKAVSKPKPPEGFENPFAPPQSSAELSAVQNQALDSGSPSGNSEFPESHR